MALLSAPDCTRPNPSIPDVSPGGTAARFAACSPGPDGKILVTAHPSSSGIARVGGADITATRGQPIAPGGSFAFTVGNASALYHVTESGAPLLCVTGV